MADGEKNVFSTHDAARICRVTPMTVIRWIEEGKIRAFKTAGGHRRILRADLESFCRERGIPLDPDLGSLTTLARRVLVLAKERSLLEAVEPEASQLGISAVGASCAFEAGRLLALVRPRLVVVDGDRIAFQLEELCGHLRSNDDNQGVAVVLCRVERPTEDDRRRLRELGVSECLTKPLRGDDIARILRDTFGAAPDGAKVRVRAGTA